MVKLIVKKLNPMIRFSRKSENPYLQYFIGLPGYQETPPFDASTLVLFRKYISAKMLMEANEYLIQENQPDKKEDDDDHHNPPFGDGSGDLGKTEESENKCTQTIDATCAPVYIRYPQDVSLLNKTREKLEERFSGFTKSMGLIFHGETARLQGNCTSVSQNQRNTWQSKSARL